MNNRTLIIGNGEVGGALAEIIPKAYLPLVVDIDEILAGLDDVGFMHICFPYGEGFVEEVLRYKALYKPEYTVIHSTVPVGTSAKCGATHSPVRGNHYEMAKSLRILVKFVGGKDADVVAAYFMRMGLKVRICRKSETTELGKLLCTTYYGVCIEYTKAAEKLCDRHNVPFSEAFTLFQETYNAGYTELGWQEVVRPVLTPIQTDIGGHCVVQNCSLIDFKFADMVRRCNEE